ncbi:TIR domain-containing protein [Gluconobacter kondonii]|uniref:TIR domain-containing protein n=1 Tax=Gluconobacter kondonii TaxID=941463 RepID=UPI0019807172|nr:nucleotide-binding protein [Gluconobacter kondonii]MBN3867677.1 nucleotide-binding protein [Gluconobacter kondonii]
MYYYVIVEARRTSSEVGRNPVKRYILWDRTNLDEIERQIIVPFFRKERFHIDGKFIDPSTVERMSIKRSENSAKELVGFRREVAKSRGINVLITDESVVLSRDDMEDISAEVLGRIEKSISQGINPSDVVSHKDNKSVFIVHGRDGEARESMARFISKLGFVPVILHEQENLGKTIIEKFEEHSACGFAIVLYTACDRGGLIESEVLKHRARQNVVFEHGYLTAKLGRGRVCAVVKGDIEIPNDISGLVYISMNDGEGWKLGVARELRSAGYPIDMNKIFI